MRFPDVSKIVVVAFLVVACVGNAQTTVTLPLNVTAEVRVRSEFDKLPSTSSDLFTYLRSRLGIRVTAAPGVRLFMQAQDSRVLGSEGIAAAANADVLELHQGYLEFEHHVNKHDFTARAGRQEIIFGNERLIGASNWTNLGRSFDGFRVTLTSDTIPKNVKWTVNAIAATVEERGRHFGAAPVAAEPTDHTVAGIFATRDFARATALETTVLYDESGKFRRYKDSDRGTVYGRARMTLLFGLRADVEAAYQFGDQDYTVTDTSTARTSQTVRAWLLGARLGTPAMTLHKWTVGVGADVLSGDATPTDKTYSAFSTMYASNHAFYGLNDVIADPSTTTRERGLVDLLATTGLNISRNVALRADGHAFSMQAGPNSRLASELDVTLPIKLGPAANIDLGYSAFRATSGAAAVGLGAVHTTRQWMYLQVRAGF